MFIYKHITPIKFYEQGSEDFFWLQFRLITSGMIGIWQRRERAWNNNFAHLFIACPIDFNGMTTLKKSNAHGKTIESWHQCWKLNKARSLRCDLHKIGLYPKTKLFNLFGNSLRKPHLKWKKEILSHLP